MQSGITLIDVWEIRWELQVWTSVWMISALWTTAAGSRQRLDQQTFDRARRRAHDPNGLSEQIAYFFGTRFDSITAWRFVPVFRNIDFSWFRRVCFESPRSVA